MTFLTNEHVSDTWFTFLIHQNTECFSNSTGSWQQHENNPDYTIQFCSRSTYHHTITLTAS